VTSTTIPSASSAPRVPGLQRAHHASFEEFADAHRHLMRDYIDSRLRTVDGISGEDAMQEAMLRMWQQWDRWPTDDQQRLRYALQALRNAATDAIRAKNGRGTTRVSEVAVDFGDLEGTRDAAGLGPQQLAVELGRAIARASLELDSDRDATADRSVLIAAFAVLDDDERAIIGLTAAGHDAKRIAQQLGLRHQHVRDKLMRARRLLRSLIEHSAGTTLRADEAKRLWEYRDGKLSGKPKREVARHIKHCATCQRLLGAETHVDQAAIRVFVPMPLLAAIGAWLHAAGTGAGAAATSTATLTTATATATATGTTSFSAVGGSGVLSGFAAKVAVALGVGAVGLSGVGVTKLYLDRDTAPAPGPAARAVLAATHIPQEGASRGVVLPRPVAAVKPARRAVARRADPRHAKTPARTTAPPPATSIAPAVSTPRTRAGSPAAANPSAAARGTGVPDGLLATGVASNPGPQSSSASNAGQDSLLP